MSSRRVRLSTEFAARAAKHSKFKSWFKQTNLENKTEKAHYAETQARHKRLANSPIAYLTKLLNKRNGY